MNQENINKLHQVRQMMVAGARRGIIPSWNSGIELINSVLFDENGAGAVLNPHSNNLKEPIIVFECQACSTKFTRDDQNFFEYQRGLCPSCWHHDLKIIQLTTKSEQEQINAVLEV